MKKIYSLIAALLIAGISSASNAACNIPTGEYKYLFSDGHESWYFNSDTTIRVDNSGSKIFQHGDFSVDVSGYMYERSGDQFTFANENGEYQVLGTGPIFFYAGTPALEAAIDAIKPGASYNDKQYGIYIKQPDGNVTFTPKRKKKNLVISKAECNKYNYAGVGYNDIPAPAPVAVQAEGNLEVYGKVLKQVVTQGPGGAYTEVTKYTGGNVKASTKAVSSAGNWTETIKLNDGTVIQKTSGGTYTVIKR